jgi:hypothetical protein
MSPADPDLDRAAAGADPRIDRLYALLPAVHRMRDAERGHPLRALLRVIAEQVSVLEDDIEGLYDDWFVETADDWAVPYLAELVGQPPSAAAPDLDDGLAVERLRALVPRRDVANVIRHRRRKGSLAVLEELARDVAGWPARAVEFFKLVGWNQNLDHPHLDRHRLADLRDMDALDRIGGPFDTLTRSIDVRRIDSRRTRGRFNVPSVGLFVFRLLSRAVTSTPALCVEGAGPHAFAFSVLGNDAPLFTKPERESEPTSIAGERHLPLPLRRRALAKSIEAWYGADKSFVIWADGWTGLSAGHESGAPVPASAIVAADLSQWRYRPDRGRVAVDPLLGRIAFPPSQVPRRGVRVGYRYGFPGDIGGGEYARTISEPAGETALYRVGEGEAFATIGDALRRWREERPASAVIELARSGVHVEPIAIRLESDQTLQVRAANGARVVLRLVDWQTDRADAFFAHLEPGSRLVLDGLIVTGRPVHVTGPGGRSETGECLSEVRIRHCTLVPGWGLSPSCDPLRPAEPSLELNGLRARVRIERSIVGSIQVQQDEVAADPLELQIDDSVVDAAGDLREAIGAPGSAIAHVALTIRRSTVLGTVEVHSVPLGDTCIFTSCVHVARRRIGCLRYCYVPPGCRTPRRYRCQPDEVERVARARAGTATGPALEAEVARERQRVRPRFVAERYGRPEYVQLSLDVAPEIRRGAADGSELGVWHHLFEPLREDRLVERLSEFTPAGMSAGILYAT